MTADELAAALPGILAPLNAAANVARDRLVQIEHVIGLMKQQRALDTQLDAALAAFTPGSATAS